MLYVVMDRNVNSILPIEDSKNTENRRPWCWKGLNGISDYVFCMLI